MGVKKIANKLIAWAFTVGIVIALVLGIVSAQLPASTVAVLLSVLIAAGIIVGFFNITAKEQKDYVLFVTALMIVSWISGDVFAELQYVGAYLQSIFSAIMAFAVPSVVVVAVRAVINLAKD
ncbi:hypothetical protein COV20_05505 [Candidatus Woesearchaeota archaeon CG10_big_fil_rev_8_21_14_0_10_45_16]|nr:MAG: hypothetical protein COV20_05505 [Candidatus Woesearchaeota archaeon CG10_big_fil_rev_8_21_14_0_10_45_16]